MQARRHATGGRLRRRGIAVVAGVAAMTLVGAGTASAAGHDWWKRGDRGAHAGRTGHRPPGHTPTGAPATAPSADPTTTPADPTPTAPAPTTPAPAPTAPDGTAAPGSPPAGPVGYTLPPANAGLDYQIGDPYTPPSGVQVVARDRGATPAAGRYNLCYVNGFQTQPDDEDWWRSTHDDLLLKRDGRYVTDADWGETLLDISTPAKREALAAIVAQWIDECAAKGFQAVEADNLDTWTRSHGLLTMEHAVAFATLLAAHAHAKGLAIGQKNALDLSSAGRTQVGFDFVVAEECADYELRPGTPECQGYIDVYGDQVFVIEYDDEHFELACERFGSRLSIVRRDVDVTAPGSRTYIFKSC